jgi:hypothetical protein
MATLFEAKYIMISDLPATNVKKKNRFVQYPNLILSPILFQKFQI